MKLKVCMAECVTLECPQWKLWFYVAHPGQEIFSVSFPTLSSYNVFLAHLRFLGSYTLQSFHDWVCYFGMPTVEILIVCSPPRKGNSQCSLSYTFTIQHFHIKLEGSGSSWNWKFLWQSVLLWNAYSGKPDSMHPIQERTFPVLALLHFHHTVFS